MSEDNKIIHTTECWFCHRKFTYGGDRFRDVTCPTCGIMNSIYDPTQIIPPEPEEDGKEKA